MGIIAYIELNQRKKYIEKKEFGNLRITTSSAKTFIQIDSYISNLGKSKNKWIKTIDQKLVDDKNLAFALIFSEKLPKSKILSELKETIINLEGCIK